MGVLQRGKNRVGRGGEKEELGFQTFNGRNKTIFGKFRIVDKLGQEFDCYVQLFVLHFHKTAGRNVSHG